MQQSGNTGDVYQMLDPFDARTRIVELDKKRDQELANEKRALTTGVDPRQMHPPATTSTFEIASMVAAMVGVVLVLSLGIVYLVVKYFPES
jgi:farnesyl-diphosphate farnesyltransferase